MDLHDTTAADAAPSQEAPAQWAILELMGHQRLAGRVSQQQFGGAALIRVDVPEVITTRVEYVNGERCQSALRIPAHSRSLGAASIYSINWCDEAAATLAAHSIRHQPLNPYSLQAVLVDMPEAQRAKVLALAAPDSPVAELATGDTLASAGNYGGSGGDHVDC